MSSHNFVHHQMNRSMCIRTCTRCFDIISIKMPNQINVKPTMNDVVLLTSSWFYLCLYFERTLGHVFSLSSVGDDGKAMGCESSWGIVFVIGFDYFIDLFLIYLLALWYFIQHPEPS